MTEPDKVPTGLVRAIRKWDLVGLGINFIVGAGIFGLPAQVFSRAGSLSLIAYAVCAAAVILIVLCFAEVGSRFSRTGGPYLYAREAFGPLIGFEAGWLRWLAGVASFAANVNLLVDYLSYLWPAGAGVWRMLMIALTSIAFTTVNVVGTRDTARISNLFAVAKLLPLILFIAIGLFFLTPANFLIAPSPGYRSFSTSVLVLVYAFVGFETLSVPAGETRHPQRSLPFALLTTIGFVTVLYLLIQIVCVGTLPDLAKSARPLTDAASAFLGAAGGIGITVAAAVSIAGNLNAQMLGTSRVLFAMAERNDLPGGLAAVHRRFHTPFVSILVTASLMLGLALSGTFGQLATMSVLVRLGMYAATCAALPILRRRSGMPAPAFKAPFGPAVAVGGVAVCVWMASNSTRREGLMAAIAAAGGLLVFLLFALAKRRFKEPRNPERETF
jgi:amino acid transporter